MSKRNRIRKRWRHGEVVFNKRLGADLDNLAAALKVKAEQAPVYECAYDENGMVAKRIRVN